MKMLIVTNGAFAKKDEGYFYAPSISTHINNLRPFFDQFIIVARDDDCKSNYEAVPDYIDVNLIPKKNIAKLKCEINKWIDDVDVVLCYDSNGYFASKIAKKHNKTCIAYVGVDPFEPLYYRGDFKGLILAPIARYMQKKMTMNSDFCHYCDEFLFERYPTKGDTLFCSGVNITCDENVLKQRLLKINNKSNDRFRIGLIGHTLNNTKGIDFAIKAVSELPENYFFEMVGKGDTKKYEEMADKLGCKNRVKFLGTLKKGNELNSWLDSLDIYIQPSRAEGLPRATIEAMSRALPIVSSNVDGIPHLIDKEYMFDIMNPPQFSKEIVKISNTNAMIEQAQRNFEKSKEYEKSVRDEKYRLFYEKVIVFIKTRGRKTDER